MLAPVLVAAASESPITLGDAKLHLKVDNDAEDVFIQALIDAAVGHIDGYSGTLGRAIMPQTWSQEYEGFSEKLRLPFGPVSSVVSLTYDETTFADFRLLNASGGAYIEADQDTSWPSASGPVVVQFIVGSEIVPAPIKAALLLHIGTLYEYRTTMVERVQPSMAYEALLAPYRVWQG